MEELERLRRHVNEQLKATALVRSALSGQPDPGMYTRYLLNAFGYSRHSSIVMALAASRCMNSHPELASYLLHHAEEEAGHYKWALADLEGFNVSEAQAYATRPAPACRAMVGYVYYNAGHANPIGIFGWMYVLEAVGEDLGGEVARKLAHALGEQKSLRFVGGHALSDVGHTHELAEQIEKFVRLPEDQEAVGSVAEVSADLYVRMFREIGQESTG
jgi:pyrroloquinoline quinone (PQQ) biosynthesis protein C